MFGHYVTIICLDILKFGFQTNSRPGYFADCQNQKSCLRLLEEEKVAQKLPSTIGKCLMISGFRILLSYDTYKMVHGQNSVKYCEQTDAELMLKGFVVNKYKKIL